MLLQTVVYYKPKQNKIFVMCEYEGIIKDRNNNNVDTWKGKGIEPCYNIKRFDPNTKHFEPYDKDVVIIYIYGTWSLPCTSYEQDIRDSILCIGEDYHPAWKIHAENLLRRYPNIIEADVIRI